MPHGVNIHRASAIIVLCDAGGNQVAIKYSDQSGRRVEQWVINWQVGWHRFADGPVLSQALADVLPHLAEHSIVPAGTRCLRALLAD